MTDRWSVAHLFFRQVNPNHWDGHTPNSQAFVPFPKDKDQLSVDDSSLVSPEGAWTHFTTALGLKSAGTWAISLGEINEAGNLFVESSPVENEEEPQKDNPAHCHVDFSEVSSKGQKRRKAQTLAMYASERGCLFQP